MFQPPQKVSQEEQSDKQFHGRLEDPVGRTVPYRCNPQVSVVVVVSAIVFGVRIVVVNDPKRSCDPKDAENLCNGRSQKPWLGLETRRLLLKRSKVVTVIGGGSSPGYTVLRHCVILR